MKYLRRVLPIGCETFFPNRFYKVLMGKKKEMNHSRGTAALSAELLRLAGGGAGEGSGASPASLREGGPITI